MTAPRRARRLYTIVYIPKFPLPNLRRAPLRHHAIVGVAISLAACRSGMAAPEPQAAAPTTMTAVTREVIVPVGQRTNGSRFRDRAVGRGGGECQTIRTTATGAVFKTAYYPSKADARVTVSLTFDSVGRLIRSTQTNGVLRFHLPPGDTTPATRDSDLSAAVQSVHSTTISLDYVTDDGLLIQRGGGRPERSMLVSTTAVGDLEVLGRPAERACEAATTCHVAAQRTAGTTAPNPLPPHSRSLMAPDDVAQRFFDAVQDEHWTEAAAFFDSTDVSANRLPSLKALLGWAQGGALTAARQPAGTPFRGGFNWARDTSKLETYDTVAVVTAAGSTTIGALARLSPEAFLATSLAARLGQPRPVAASQVVGFVTEGDSVAHVVFRTQYLNSRFATPPTQRELLHMRRVSGRWMIIPTSPFVSAGDMAAAAMNYRPPRTSN